MNEGDLHIGDIFFHYYLISTTLSTWHWAQPSSRCHCNLLLISVLLNSLGKVLDVISEDYPLILCLPSFRHTAGPCDPIALESPCQATHTHWMVNYRVKCILCSTHLKRRNGHLGVKLVCSGLPDDDNRDGKGSLGDIHYYSNFTAKTKYMTHCLPLLDYTGP